MHLQIKKYYTTILWLYTVLHMDNTNERNRRHLSTKKKKQQHRNNFTQTKKMFITLDLALPAGNNVLRIVNNQDAKGTKRQNRS